MRPPVDKTRLEAFMKEVGKRFRGNRARVHLVGGCVLVHDGLKAATVDIDLDIRETPPQDQGELLGILRDLKKELDLNIEEAAPPDFIPVPAGASDRAGFIGTYGRVDFYRYDPYSVALAKIERGQERDFEDVATMIGAGSIEWHVLETCYHEVLPLVPEKGLKGDAEKFARHFEEARSRWEQSQGKKPS